MFPSLRMAALASSLVLALAACGGKAPATAEGAADAAADAPEHKVDAGKLGAQHVLAAKLNAYVTCYNSVDSTLQTGARLYTRWIKDLDAGPSGRETSPSGPADLDDYRMKPCEGPVEKAISGRPPLPALDTAARNYVDAIKALRPISHEVYDYYKRDNYEDDQFAKGKALHAPLMAALTTFAAASEAFSNELEVQNNAAQQAQLQLMEQAEGRTRSYYRLAIMLEAKGVIDLMSNDDFDVGKAGEQLAAFKRITDEAHERVADQEPRKVDWATFEMRTESFRREGKERLKRVADKVPYTEMERRMMDLPTAAPSGSPARLMKAYNDLVFQGNLQ